MGGPTVNYQPRVEWLVGTAHNVYSQFGEDGLIAATLERIGTTCRQCFEVGAADGRFFSNTLFLREHGWFSVLMEQDEKQFTKLLDEFGNESECLFGAVSDLDGVLLDTPISDAPDLGIIDIDGQDYWLWHDMERVRPRVMLVEIFPPDVGATVDRGGFGQAGLHAIESLGKDKGYTCVATTHCNALFVEESCLS